MLGVGRGGNDVLVNLLHLTITNCTAEWASLLHSPEMCLFKG